MEMSNDIVRSEHLAGRLEISTMGGPRKGCRAARLEDGWSWRKRRTCALWAA